MVASHARRAQLPGFDELTSSLLDATWFSARLAGTEGVIQRATNTQVLQRLMLLATDPAVNSEVRALALDAVNALDGWLEARAQEGDSLWRAHFSQARLQIQWAKDQPERLLELMPVVVPPGSPIGSDIY